MPCDQGQQQQQKIQTVKQKQYCNKFNQDFKNSPHQKTNKQTQCPTCKILGSMLQMGKLRLGATKWPHQALLLGGAELPHHRPSCLFCSCHRTEDHSQLFPSSDLGCCSTLPWLCSDQWPPPSFIAVEFKSVLFWTFEEMLWNFVLLLPHLRKWKTAPEQSSYKKNLGPIGVKQVCWFWHQKQS